MFSLFSVMAGPVARRFVAAIEDVIAQEIVEMARHRPQHLVIFTYSLLAPNAVPFVMVSKFEAGMSDLQFKVRVWDEEVPGLWEYCTPIFPSINQAAVFIARSLTPDPCRFLGIGVMNHFGGIPHVMPVLVENTHLKSTSTEWLDDDDASAMFDDYIENLGDQSLDCFEARGDWVEQEEHFEILLENVIFSHLQFSFSD